MARQVLITMVSDLSGKEGDVETVEFAWRGVSYEVDLTASEVEGFERALSKYRDVARRVSGGKRVKRGTPGEPSVAKRVREWAATAGVEVPQRGRIPAAIVEQYEAAVGAA